jgi:hypothetical protein
MLASDYQFSIRTWQAQPDQDLRTNSQCVSVCFEPLFFSRLDLVLLFVKRVNLVKHRCILTANSVENVHHEVMSCGRYM